MPRMHRRGCVMAGLTITEKQRKWELFNQGLKLCRKCGHVLLLEKFDRCKTKSDGVDSRCKACKTAQIPNAGKRKRKTQRRKLFYAQGLRECMDCHQTKSISEFPKNKSGPEGLSSYCLECGRAKSRRGNTGKRAQKKKEQRELAVQGLKRCSTCHRILPVSEFYSGLPHTYDGRVTQCRQCIGYKGTQRQQEEQTCLAQQELRRCPSCLKIKVFSEFYRNRGKRNNLSSRCKQCLRDSLKISKAIRLARQAGLPNDFTKENWVQTKAYWNGQCAYCGKEPAQLTMDHVIPLVLGGGTTRNNIVPCCLTCNCSKSAKSLQAWAQNNDQVLPNALMKIQEYFATLLQEG